MLNLQQILLEILWINILYTHLRDLRTWYNNVKKVLGTFSWWVWWLTLVKTGYPDDLSGHFLLDLCFLICDHKMIFPNHGKEWADYYYGVFRATLRIQRQFRTYHHYIIIKQSFRKGKLWIGFIKWRRNRKFQKGNHQINKTI